MALARHAMRAAGLMAVGLAVAAGTHAQVAPQAEVEFLITRIAHSGCQFVRNGSAHPAAEAAAHLRRKLNAAPRGLSTEQFIEHVASKSSMTGAPYLIRCDGRDDEASAVWLRRALKERSG